MRLVIRIGILALLVAALACTAVPSAPAYTTIKDLGPHGYTPPAIRVAVVHSQTTLDWLNKRGTPSKYPHGGKEAALLYYLRCRGYNVTEIVGDRDITDAKLKNFNVVVLNSMYGMGYPASEALARYVANGGGLVSTIGSPRVNPAYMPPRGTKSGQLTEWWWRVMKEKGGLHYWEWGPLSVLYSEGFVNDGAYTPEFTLKPNPSSPIIKQTQDILDARGYSDDISGITLHHPGANLEMSLPLPGTWDASSTADFNILTPSVKKLYPKKYSAIMATRYGAGRTVKFDYGASDFLEPYSYRFYSPHTPTGVPQGEVGGALIESAIIWAGTVDNVVAHSIDATTYADVKATGATVSAKQVAQNVGNAMTMGTVNFAIYSPSGKTLKSWTAKKVRFFPHQKMTFSYSFSGLPAGACKVVARFTFGYPASGKTTTSQSALSRGQTVRTQ